MMQCGRSMVIVKSWCNRFGQRSQYSSEEALKAVLQTVEPKVTPEVNSCLLISLPDLEEIKGVVFACGRFKALGLDGLPPHCFQQFWDDTKDVLFRWFSKLLKIPHANLPKRYLGVPMNFDTPKIVMFNNLVDQTITQLQHWKTSILSPEDIEKGNGYFLLVSRWQRQGHPLDIMDTLVSSQKQRWFGYERSNIAKSGFTCKIGMAHMENSYC
ncbi:hypothetical protein NE237_004328 [Protea cynaroides]|uniref:Reverse transcriptase n=1 Tax=Protea cynaroides TaxID=273540 RepID=A0A9Q0KJ94_9MAGN|nr:hypothetical protein NE237_004328 [Protea cynaroides]